MPGTLEAPTANLTDLHIVARGTMTMEGIVRERGEVLNTSSVRMNVQALVNQRYLTPVPYDLFDHIVECSCGRRWKDDESSAAHSCPDRKD